MKLSASNIAWSVNDDTIVFEHMKQRGFTGLEIAPTRLIEVNPYDSIDLAKQLTDDIRSQTGFNISSMQSILFGRTEQLFGSEKDREYLFHHLNKAVQFASAIGCGNLVFGSPKNRNMPTNGTLETAIEFFRNLGMLAWNNNVVVSLEPNPPIYGTNFINTIKEAAIMVQEVSSPGFRINLDFGALIENKEKPEELINIINFVNHVHISEPNLVPIIKREQHKLLRDILKGQNFQGFVSLEMKKDSLDTLMQSIDYLAEVFKD